MTNRSQRVAIGSVYSNEMHFKYGVPQGSVFGYILYLIFFSRNRLVKFGVKYHCYADDTQVYLVIEPLDSWTNIPNRIEACLEYIRD